MRRVIATLGTRLLKTPVFYFSTVKPQLISVPRTKVETRGLWRPLRYNFSGSKQSITMPALSPTMNSGKIVKWTKKVGDKIEAGDLLCEVETDKATVDFETNSEGYLAKIVKGEGESADVGEEVAVIVENEADIKSVGSEESPKKESKSSQKQKPKKQEKKQQKQKKQEKKEDKEEKSEEPKEQKAEKKQAKQQSKSEQVKQSKQSSQSAQSGDRIIASPLAKSVANEKSLSLQGVKGSGPGGRIIEQDVQQLVQKSSQKPKAPQTKKAEGQAPSKAGKFVAPENPFEEIPITGMRKTIAARLIESKTTIPHYYISADVIMDNIDQLRATINASETENGVKITVNDFILKAAALALRDFPTVNVQWGEKSIKQFKYCDVSMAVSTESGLITPIIYRAQTKGLIQIAKQTKELAKKARQNKLQPSEFVGGTISVSNAGMYGLTQMISVINPPQAIILGVAKSEKKILFDDKSTNPDKPYKVAGVMTVWASVDHRLVDGALAAQYLARVKKYLQNPVNMIL